MNQKELKELIDLVAEKEFAEFEIERSGFRLKIKRSPDQIHHAAPVITQPHILTPVPPPPIEFPTPVRQSSSAPQPQPKEAEPEADQDKDIYIIKSPIVGTFYRAPSPTSAPFVKVGDTVQPGSVLCIVEAMKLMNEIESDVAGTIVKIYMESALPVEYGQPLFGIKK